VFLQRYERVLHDSELGILSGSIPPNVPTDIYATLIKMANDKYVPTIINVAKAPLESAIEAGPAIVCPDMRSSYNMYGKKTETVEDYLDLAKTIMSKSAKIQRSKNICARLSQSRQMIRPYIPQT